jgi:hypothetical protein
MVTRVPTSSFVFLLLFSSMIAWAGDAPDQTSAALGALTRYFAEARTLPSGTRPRPPQVNLKGLIGLPSDAIRRSLGPPDPPVENYDFACHASECWVYTYGAKENFAEGGQICEEGSDLCSIVVTTGGPFLLIVGVSSGHVVTARWQGQK